MSFKLGCIKCGKSFPFALDLTTCPDHNQKYGYLQIIYNSPTKKELPLLPVKNFSVNLGQVRTPLIKATNLSKVVGLDHLYIKEESKNPTGSFKDRENFIFFNYLVEQGIKETVYVISSGNAALSTAAYANKAGFDCLCYLPKKTSRSKKAMLNLYNGKIIEVDGSYEEIYNKIINSSQKGLNATPSICPLKEEGDKLIAYELVEQLAENKITPIPDKILVPCGNGVLLWSVYKGFKEMLDAKVINSLPQMIGVQVYGGDPLAEALRLNKDYIILKEAPDSVAEGIVATESFSSPKAVKAIKSTGGFMVSVSEEEILEAHKQIINLESIIPELTSSTVYAALKKIKFKKDEVVVCINTGTGFKDIHQFLQLSHSELN